MIEKHTPLYPLSPTQNTLAAPARQTCRSGGEGTDYALVLYGSYDLRFSARGGSPPDHLELVRRAGAFGGKRPLSSVGLRDETSPTDPSVWRGGEQTRPNDR
jgi:hypothetical protein